LLTIQPALTKDDKGKRPAILRALLTKRQTGCGASEIRWQNGAYAMQQRKKLRSKLIACWVLEDHFPEPIISLISNWQTPIVWRN